MVQHPLHLLIDLIGGRATVLFASDHAPVTFRRADRFVTLTPVDGQGSLFPAAV